jgi:F420H(2)-dependent quinone reductase
LSGAVGCGDLSLPRRFPAAKPSLFVMMRVANRLVAAVLSSRFHRVLSGRLTLLSYTGRRSGRKISLPVGYEERGPDHLTITVGGPSKKVWWRNLRDEAPVSLVLRGSHRSGLARSREDQSGEVIVEVRLRDGG